MTTERDEEGGGGEKGKRRRKKWKGGKVEERRTGEFGEEVEGRVEGVEWINIYSMTLP